MALQHQLSALVVFVCLFQLRTAATYAGPALWRTYTSSSYYYTDYAVPKPAARKFEFLPGPQYCPDTGRTVCKDVERYPADHIFQVITSTKARRFNFSSVFVDERDGDNEPNLEKLPDSPPKQREHDGYIVYQTSVHYDYQVPTNSPWTYGHQQPGAAPYPVAAAAPQRPIYPGAPPVQRYPSHTYRRGRRNEDVEPACTVRTQYVSPRAALNDKSEWKYVINVAERDPKYRQVIRVDICGSPGEPCSSQLSLPFGFTSRCRQKFIKKKLLSLDADGQGTSSENFFVPSCCVCELVRNLQK